MLEEVKKADYTTVEVLRCLYWPVLVPGKLKETVFTIVECLQSSCRIVSQPGKIEKPL